MFSLSQDLQLACKGNDFERRKENLFKGIKIEVIVKFKPSDFNTLSNHQTRNVLNDKKQPIGFPH